MGSVVSASGVFGGSESWIVATSSSIYPRQSKGVEKRFPQLIESDFNTGLRLIVGAEDIHVGADAVYEIYRRMPPFHMVTWLYRLPVLGGFFRACYYLIARNRHLFGRAECDTGGCTPSGLQAKIIHPSKTETI